MCNENDTAYMRQMVSEILNCYEEIFTNKRELPALWDGYAEKPEQRLRNLLSFCHSSSRAVAHHLKDVGVFSTDIKP